MKEERMKTTYQFLPVILFVCSGFFLSVVPASGEQSALDICGQISADELAVIHRKPLYPEAYENECLWSETPGGMAFLHITVGKIEHPLRDYYVKDLPASVRLEKITGIGDEGLVNISEGTLGVIVIRKGDRLIKSNVVFLDIKPNSKKQEAFYTLLRRIVDQV